MLIGLFINGVYYAQVNARGYNAAGAILLTPAICGQLPPICGQICLRRISPTPNPAPTNWLTTGKYYAVPNVQQMFANPTIKTQLVVGGPYVVINPVIPALWPNYQ